MKAKSVSWFATLTVRPPFWTHCSRSHLTLIADATFVKSTGITDNILRQDIGHYLLSYLKVLQSGGHHTLLFPPKFAEPDRHSNVHFSLTGSRKDRVPLNHIFGCMADMINGYLSLLWYTCTFIAHEQDQGGRPVCDRSSWLAGYSS